MVGDRQGIKAGLVHNTYTMYNKSNYNDDGNN